MSTIIAPSISKLRSKLSDRNLFSFQGTTDLLARKYVYNRRLWKELLPLQFSR